MLTPEQANTLNDILAQPVDGTFDIWFQVGEDEKYELLQAHTEIAYARVGSKNVPAYVGLIVSQPIGIPVTEEEYRLRMKDALDAVQKRTQEDK